MKKEDLQLRIEKKEQAIAKIEKRIAKWSKGMNDEAKEIAKNSITSEGRDIFNSYKKLHYEDTTCYSDELNKGPNLEELRRAYFDLSDAYTTLNKYKVAMNEIINFENKDKIEVLVNFLNDWKEKAYNWYLANANKYIQLRRNRKHALEEAKRDPDFMLKYKDNYFHTMSWAENNWERDYYKEITQLAKNIVEMGEVNTEKLSDILNEEVKSKYEDLVNRITKVVGQITNVNNLSIGEQSREINGYVEGTNGKCYVNTISAGGYNIQCFHYRVLVNKVK